MFEKRDLLKHLEIIGGEAAWEADDENCDEWDQYHLIALCGQQLGGVMRDSSGEYRAYGWIDALTSLDAKGFASVDLAKAAVIPIIRNALQGRLDAIKFAEDYPKNTPPHKE